MENERLRIADVMKKDFPIESIRSRRNVDRYGNGYPSVTEVLGVLRKVGLEMWYKHNTAAFCDAESKKGREIGTQIHTLIQNYIEGKEPKIETIYDSEIKTVVESFALFRKEYPDYKLVRAEQSLFNKEYKYNGTLDCIATRQLGLKKNKMELYVILDWKTGKCKENDKPPLYDEYFAQVAAYVKACEEIEKLGVNQVPVAALAVFAKDKVGYNFQLIAMDEIDFYFNEFFLPALKIWNTQEKMKEIKKIEAEEAAELAEEKG
ncbi:MAG: PD-(D/E)XK nuclease family protein [Elusimicrobiota bacterium]|jgi:hypothetical protein|nr:PD-(D/E)XK nuclease family protein [Elusimicrobiota bacterium]